MHQSPQQVARSDCPESLDRTQSRLEPGPATSVQPDSRTCERDSFGSQPAPLLGTVIAGQGDPTAGPENSVPREVQVLRAVAQGPSDLSRSARYARDARNVPVGGDPAGRDLFHGVPNADLPQRHGATRGARKGPVGRFADHSAGSNLASDVRADRSCRVPHRRDPASCSAASSRPARGGTCAP